MKKCFLILMTVCTIQTSYSQTEKGKMFLGGQFSLYGDRSVRSDFLFKSENKALGFSVAPNFGYFVANNFAIGTSLNFGISKIKNYSENNYDPSNMFTNKSENFNTIYGLGGFARYFINITDNLKFYLNGGFRYSYSVTKRNSSTDNPNITYNNQNPPNQETQSNTLSFDITPGLVYFVHPKLGILASFGSIYYQHNSSKNKSLPFDNEGKNSNFGINLNLSSFNFGLNYHF